RGRRVSPPCGRPHAPVRRGVFRRHREHRLLHLLRDGRLVKPGGPVGIANVGWMREIEGAVPGHLRQWWAQDQPVCFHSAPWWRRHWERSGIVDVELADTLPDGWELWRDWLRAVAPDNQVELSTLEADRGSYMGYVRLVGRRRPDAPLYDPVV